MHFLSLPPGRQRSVSVVMTEGVNLSSAHIFCDLVRAADALMAERNALLDGWSDSPRAQHGPLALTRLSIDGGPVRSAHGPLVQVDGSLADAKVPDLLFIPSHMPGAQPFDPVEGREASVPALLSRMWHDGALIAVAGYSVIRVAQSGILDRRTATIGLSMSEGFRRHFPAVRLDGSRPITEDSNIFCANNLGAQIALACDLLSRVNSNWVGEAVFRSTLPYGFEAQTPRLKMTEAASPADLMISNAVLWIARNYSRCFRTSDLAAALSVSERTLRRRFEEVMHATPQAYMRQLRLDVAARQLRKTRMSIETISRRVGYNAVDFFNKIFREQYGLSPAEYRQSAKTEAS